MPATNHTHLAETYSTTAICARLLERHRAAVSIQKRDLAVAKLSTIMGAALTLGNRHGFHAMTLRELAVASKLSMGGLYSYFDSKNTLLLMILDGVSSSAMEVLGTPPADVIGQPWRHLRWLIETHVALTEVMQPWFVFAYMEAKSFPSSAKRIAVDSEAATEAIISDVLKAGIESGEFVIDNPALTASLIKPLLQDWYVKRSKYRKAGVGMADYVEGVTNFVRSAVTAPAP